MKLLVSAPPLLMVVAELGGLCCFNGVAVISMFSSVCAVVARSSRMVSGLESVCSVL